jgi:hypothetical protein
MCLTGSLSVALLSEECVGAAVVCQPATPIAAWTKSRKEALNLAPLDLTLAKQRSSRSDVPPILGFRFEQDSLSPSNRFDQLKRLFGDKFIEQKISAAFYAKESPGAHSVFTGAYDDQAEVATNECFRNLMDYLSTNLVTRPMISKDAPNYGGSRIERQLARIDPFGGSLYLLDFDENGELANPETLSRISLEIKNRNLQGKPKNKILVLSYGWNNTRDQALETYLAKIEEFQAETKVRFQWQGGKIDTGEWIILCVGWNSKNGTVGNFLKDVIPAPRTAELLAWAPEKMTFPLTYWSKSRLADQIGYGDLKEALEYVVREGFPSRTEQAEIYLVGHSFGCRILSPLTKTHFGSHTLKDPFRYRENIKGAVFLEPALCYLNLPVHEKETCNFPMVITQSRHDHANGAIYPLGNMLLNSYTFTRSAVVVDKSLRFFFPSGDTALVGGYRQAWLIPFSIALTAFYFPVDYLSAQRRQIKDRGWRYLGDSMAQLPIIEAPLRWTERLFSEKEPEFGNHHKGLFEMGPIYESASRVVSSPSLGPKPPAVELYHSVTNWGLNGIRFVDVSRVVSKSSVLDFNFHEDTTDFTVGWVDPIGAHARYQGAYGIVRGVLRLQTGQSASPNLTASESSGKDHSSADRDSRATGALP